MGNTPSIDESNKKAKDDLENAFSPYKNGVAEQFDPNNSNGLWVKS